MTAVVGQCAPVRFSRVAAALPPATTTSAMAL
jgi:hypothetical protein